MPNSAHRKKTLRQDKVRNLRNRSARASMRTAVKNAQEAISEDPQNADAALAQAYKKLDKAAKTNLIHPNKAARTKSRLAKAAQSAKSDG